MFSMECRAFGVQLFSLTCTVGDRRSASAFVLDDLGEHAVQVVGVGVTDGPFDLTDVGKPAFHIFEPFLVSPLVRHVFNRR